MLDQNTIENAQSCMSQVAHFDAFLIASLDLDGAFAFKGRTNLRSRHERYGRPRNIQKSF